jgi:hypothetical protein
VAWEARTGPRQTQMCSDTPATARLRRGSPLTTHTTANQTTTSHCLCGRSGRESHDSKANDDEGSPRLQPPANIRTLALH